MKSIYVVTYEVGAYEDRNVHMLRAFFDEDKARAYIDSLIGKPYSLLEWYGYKATGNYDKDDFGIEEVEVE